MELIPKDTIFEFNPDTLQYLRKQYDLDKPGRIDEAINLLDDWIQKQSHFMKKDFTRDYLERTIIISKGSVERAKLKLDKICTFRTLYPDFFGIHDVKSYETLNDLHGAFLPKLTPDHYRIYLFKNISNNLDKGLHEFYRYFFMQCEYIQAKDYCNGVVVVLDYREANLMDAVKVLNIADMRKALAIMKDGYGMRINGIHFLTDSKAIDAIVSIFKQVFSLKVVGRILTHRSFDTLYDYVPKDNLPEEYGGKEKSLIDIHRKFQDVLSSKDFTDYLTEMNKACTNEDLRQDSIDDEYLGVPGSFRTLSVD